MLNWWNSCSTGRPGTAMAGWKDRLTEAEIADIIAFLRTWNPIH